MAATLEDAANLSYARISVKWAANTVRANTNAFIIACALVLDDNVPNDRTVGNWLVPLNGLATQMAADSNNPMPQSLFNTLVEWVYRMMMAAAYAQSQSRITTAQANALLAAWNTNYGP